METKAAIYVRVSTKDGRQDVDNQLAQLKLFAETQKWNVVKIYQDHASGKTSNRDALQSMFADAHKHRFDILLFWSLDRFSREGTLATLHHLQRLSSCNVNYHSYTEQYINTCGVFRDVVISMLATLAKQERVRISERTVAGMQESRRKGGKPAGRPRKEFDLKLAQRLRAEGLSFQQIAKQLGISKTLCITTLNSLSVPPPPQSAEASQ